MIVCFVFILALTCPATMVYQSKASACLPTCNNPNAASLCGLPDTESCTCPTGQLSWKGQCVTPDNCGCLHYNNYYNVRTFILIIIHYH